MYSDPFYVQVLNASASAAVQAIGLRPKRSSNFALDNTEYAGRTAAVLYPDEGIGSMRQTFSPRACSCSRMRMANSYQDTAPSQLRWYRPL